MRAALWHRLPGNFLEQLDAVIAGGIREFHFDDGYDDIDLAGEELEDRGHRGVFFVVTGWLGLEGFATEADVRSLQERGHEIGNHTAHHVMLTKVAASVVREELRQGEEDLGRITSRWPHRIAWPYGLAPAGFDGGRGITEAEVFVPRTMTGHEIRRALR